MHKLQGPTLLQIRKASKHGMNLAAGRKVKSIFQGMAKAGTAN